VGIEDIYKGAQAAQTINVLNDKSPAATSERNNFATVWYSKFFSLYVHRESGYVKNKGGTAGLSRRNILTYFQSSIMTGYNDLGGKRNSCIEIIGKRSKLEEKSVPLLNPDRITYTIHVNGELRITQRSNLVSADGKFII